MDKENVMIIEFTDHIGGVHPVEMVAMFNQTKISENLVKEIIQERSEHELIIVVTKRQFKHVFGT